MSHTTNGSDHLQEPALRYARQDFHMIRNSVTVGEALNIIRREGVGERIIYFYIINDEGQLAGIIPTRRLLTASADHSRCHHYRRPYDFGSRYVQDLFEIFVKHKFLRARSWMILNHMRGVLNKLRT
jgi:hypothetical protein